MKRTTYYCDRCGKEIRDWGKSRSIAVAEITYDNTYKGELEAPEDLCGDCYKSLEAWWKQGGNTE